MHDHDHSEQEHIVPTEEMLSDLAELYKIFGDSTRIKILYALFENEKQARLVKARREGKMVYYALGDDHVRTIFAQGLDHILE